MKRSLLSAATLAAAVAAVSSLTGCVTASPDVVHPYHAQRMSRVQEATILTMRPVTVDGQQSGAGAVTGGVVGGIAGSSIGGYRDGAVGGVIGAVAGAVIGNAIERDATREQAWEIIVQMRNGEQRSVVQGKGAEALAPGDRVLLVTTGGRTRVTRAPANMPEHQATAPRLPPPIASPARPADATSAATVPPASTAPSATAASPYPSNSPAAAMPPASGASAPIFTPRAPN
ncbi:glycine zipper 2TM domain-containing protein [Ideonella sp. DXS29W]|uniref:Glycine zipper 2TM domain-containing protein n=1 Tax=Ideonella lacteola TaxID=2984193 RepID=A0ABU9BPB1_9BURK